MQTNRLLVWVGGVVGAVMLVAGTVWFVAPFVGSDEPERVSASAPARPQASKAQRRAARPQLGNGPIVYAEERAPGAGRAGGPRAGARAGAAAGARAASAQDRATQFNGKLDAYADQKGWEAEKTEAVRSIVLGTAKSARETLSEARQARDRELAKTGIQQLRADQAEALAKLLGPEESKAFTAELQAGQFFPRVAERRGAPRRGARGARQ